MFALFVLFLAVFTLTMGFYAIDKNARGWYWWFVASFAFFVNYMSFIKS